MAKITDEEIKDRILSLYDWVDLTESVFNGANGKFDFNCKHCGDTKTTTPKALRKSNGKFRCEQCRFIKEAKDIHGDKYDYSKTIYKSMRADVTIKCPEHGYQTMQSYYHHNFGCKKCVEVKTKDRRENEISDTKQKYFKKYKEFHGDKYDYSKFVYTNCDIPTTIICPKHGEFQQSPKSHLKSQCMKCFIEDSTNTKDFYLPLFREKHGDKYDYSLLPDGIMKSDKEIKIICPMHGVFNQIADTHRRHGCGKCSTDGQRLSEDEMRRRIESYHKDRYDYSDVDFSEITSTKNFINVKCEKHGFFKQLVGSHINGDGCPKCRIPRHEVEIVEYIESIYSGDIKTSDRTVLDGKELDVYIPDANLAIEHNGIYWHSEQMGKDKNYHLDKTQKCESDDISLLHVIETEWHNRKDIVKSIINTKLGINNKIIYARKTEVKDISVQQYRDFCVENHIQSNANAQIKIGLFYEDELVSVMSFSKSRYNKKYQYEMIRYCNKTYTRVTGGASKLFKYFVNTYEPESVITYSNKRYFDGKVYESLGFNYDSDSKPNYFYFNTNCGYKIDNLILESRNKYQKHKQHKILEKFDPKLTEYQNMLCHGFDRIWDCGNRVFTWENPNPK